MAPLLKKVSTITEKGQVTIPKPVRDALGLDYGGRIAFYIDEHRHVSLKKEDETSAEDPVIESFLAFIARDLEKHPERNREFPDVLMKRIHDLTESMEVDPDEPIIGDVDL